MEVKPGHKQTGVGVIPDDWEVKSAHEFAVIRTGPFGTLLNASEYSERDGVPLISVGEIREGFVRITDHTPCVPDAVTQRLPQFILRRGDIVFGRKGGVERSALIRQPQEGWFLGSDGISIRPSQDYHDEYLALQFRSARVQGWLVQNAIGTTMPSLNQEILRNVAIPLPPTLAEQEAIAEALSDADALIESLEQLLTKKRQTKKGAMQELLTGKKRLPGFSGEWKVKKISEVATDCSEKNSLAEALPVLTCSKHLGFVDSLTYFKNQVFSKDLSGYKIIRRGQIGYPANHIEEGSIGLQDLYDVALVSPIYVVCSPKEGTSSYFLHRLLKLDSYRQEFAIATTSSVDRRGSLRWPAFSEIAVNLPHIKEQRAIATVLSAMDAEIAALETKRSKARQLKQGMMQELLTGRIRLL